MKRILLFADAHVAPGQNLDRFKALGNMIVKEKPDAIGCLGDLATCDSVSFWDVPARQRPTLRQDVQSVHQALSQMFRPLAEYNLARVKSRKRQYWPFTFVTMGNHQDRIDRRLERDQFGFGSMTSAQKVLRYDVYFQKVVPYKQYFDYAGILFTHAPINANNVPFSGHYRGRHIGIQARQHIVYGHSHKIDLTTCYFIGNSNDALMTLNLPAFMDQDHVEQYAKQTPTGWSYGVVMLTIDEKTGNFGFNWLTTQQLIDTYLEEENGQG